MASETDSLLSNGAATDRNRTNGGKLNLFYLVVAAIIGFGLGILVPRIGESFSSHQDEDVKRNKRNSKYTATQFISFSINTLGGMDEYGECEGRSVDPRSGLCYLGDADNLEEDLNHRFAILTKVLKTIKEDELNEFPEIDHSSHVLKIFMLPEFILRGPHGAYHIEELSGKDGLLIQLADRLHKLLQRKSFENYLFVLGTVIAAKPLNGTTAALLWNTTDQEIDEDEISYYNFAPVYRGGTTSFESFLVPKKYISTADFLNRKKGLPDPRRSHVSEYSYLDEDQKIIDFLLDERNVTGVMNNVFEVDGIRFGIEICLDHRLGMLWKNLQKTGGDLVDVHLITSAGMSIERGPTPVKSGGVVYLTDGEASSAACQRTDHHADFDPAAVCRDRHNDGPTGLRHVPNGGPGYSSYIELATCLNPKDAPWKPLMDGYYSIHATQGCAYTLSIHGINVFDEYEFYPPSIEIYPTIDLP